MEVCIKAPAWFPFILRTGVFWNMILDLTVTIMGMCWYVKELTQMKNRHKRPGILRNIVARGVCMNISCGLLGYLTLDHDIFHMPRRLRPYRFFRNFWIMARILCSFAVTFIWFKHLVTLIQRSVHKMNTERLKSATWSFKAAKRELQNAVRRR